MSATSDLFARAVKADSNREMDWLWLAQQLTSASERQFCLEKALYINPASAIAARDLATLRREQRASATHSALESAHPALHRTLLEVIQR